MEMHYALWQIINQTDAVSKFILLCLLGMSVICWAFTIYKIIIIRTKMRHIKQAQFILQNINSLEDFLTRSATLQDNFVGDLIAKYLIDFKCALKFQENSTIGLSDTDWLMLESNINQDLDEAIQEEELFVPVLSTSAQAAPLIGLFGTVWGLIHAFLGIAQQRSADIAAVAPGIAEALITTLAGLVVAIPALVMCNYIIGQLRLFEQNLIAMTDQCLWIMRMASKKIQSQTQAPVNTGVFVNAQDAAQRDAL